MVSFGPSVYLDSMVARGSIPRQATTVSRPLARGENGHNLTRKAASTSLVARVKADPYVVSHSTPEWTADAHPELVRAEVGR
jgi:hypothetical protein